MKRLRALILLLLLLVPVGAAVAQSVGVKVIALFANKALLQVGDKQKVVSAGKLSRVCCCSPQRAVAPSW